MEGMEDLKTTLLSRLGSMEEKFGALEKMQSHLEGIDGKLNKHAETLEQM